MQVRTLKSGLVAAACAVAFGITAPNGYAQGIDLAKEAACQSLTATSMGGPAPKSSNVAVVRWLGGSDSELVYRDNVILLDAAYHRTSPARPLGFTRDDIKKVSAIFVGHAHGAHIADAPYVAKRTGAAVYGAPITAGQLKKMGLPDKQIITVRSGEGQKLNGLTVEPILARHIERTPEFSKTTGDAYRTILAATNHLPRPLSEQERAGAVAEGSQGSNDPAITDQGLLAYLFTFDNSYRLVFLDNAGPVTEGERKVMERIGGRTDMAIVAYQGLYVSPRMIELAMPLIRLFNPRVYIPTNHEETAGFPDMAIYPLAMAIRDEMPGTRTIAPMYRTPICIDTQAKKVFVDQ